jgi:ATP phosphoribosyltransferase regulatory subunit
MPISFSIDAFRRIDAITEIFRTESKLYGYTSIIPGSITSYHDLTAFYPEALRRSVKYTGPDGNIYTVKSDPTHFVTQLASQNKRTGQRSQKYAYSTSKLNWRTNNGNTVESLQCGLEIYDSTSVLSEAETIRVACRVLEKSGIGKIMIDLGNTMFTEILLDTNQLTKEEQTQVRMLIDSKNLPELDAFLDSTNIDAELKSAFMLVPQLFGAPTETINRALTIAKSPKAIEAIERVNSLCSTLLDYGIDDTMIKIDFSFTNNYSYYTNTIYKIYTADSGQVLAAGGRYDNAFGYGLSACGIALYLNEINEVIEMKQLRNSNLYSKDFAIYYSNKDQKNAFRLSDKLREMGFIVTASEQTYVKDYSVTSDAEEILCIEQGQLEITNQRMNTFSRSTFEQFIRKVEDQYVPSSIH